jgi:hypothetical protein
MNPAGRPRCNIMPIANGYGRVPQSFFDCASHTSGKLAKQIAIRALRDLCFGITIGASRDSEPSRLLPPLG